MNCISVTRMLANRASHHLAHAVGHAHRVTAKAVHAVAQPLSLCGEVAGPLAAFQAARLAALVAGVAAAAASAAPTVSLQGATFSGPSGYLGPSAPASYVAASGGGPGSDPVYSGHDLVGPVAVEDPFKPATLYSLVPPDNPLLPGGPAAVPAPIATTLLASVALLAAIRLRRRHPR